MGAAGVQAAGRAPAAASPTDVKPVAACHRRLLLPPLPAAALWLTLRRSPPLAPCPACLQYITPSFASNTLHFIGLLSDGGVHSRTDQL